MAKAPEQLKVTGYRRSYYISGTIPQSHGETTTTVTTKEDCQTHKQFDRVSSSGRSADTQISLTGSDRAISQSPQERTKGKRLIVLAVAKVNTTSKPLVFIQCNKRETFYAWSPFVTCSFTLVGEE